MRPENYDLNRPKKKRVRFVDEPPPTVPAYTNEYFDRELKRGTLADQATAVAKQGVHQILNAFGPLRTEQFIPTSVLERKQKQLEAIRNTPAPASKETYTPPMRRAVARTG